VLDGRRTFDVGGEIVVGTPGQAIYLLPRIKHRVYTRGPGPARYYLSVTPHVEPTHTHYDADLQRKPPSYGGWRAAGDPSPRSTQATAELADTVAAEAERLAELAQKMATALRRDSEQLRAASLAGGDAAAKPSVDAMWEAAYPALRQVRTFELAWNQLAPRVMP
jgi:hypothetical protein